MRQARPRLKATINLLLALTCAHAFAGEPEAVKGSPKICANLEAASGEVRLLDSSRTELTDPLPNAAVACGGWVSVSSSDGERGWASVRHRNGTRVFATDGSFLQISDVSDSFVLYRGKIFGWSGGGTELKVMTANARAEVARGLVMLVYSQTEEETQLVAMEGKAWLENRFQRKGQIQVKAGEASSLNFRQLRTVPSTPRAVSVAALKRELQSYPIPVRDRAQALMAAHIREERKFAASISEGAPGEEGAREPASEPEVRKPYVTHIPRGGDEKLRKRFAGRMIASDVPEDAKNLLFPKTTTEKRLSKGKVQVDDLMPVEERQRAKAEAREKQRLIEELSRIRPE